MNKKKKILTGIAALFILIIGYFCYQYLFYVTTDNAQIEAHAVMLAPKVGGFITKVNVTEGMRVKKDDTLVEIDERDFKNSFTQIHADLESILARKNDAEKNFRRLQTLIKSGAVSQQQFDSAASLYSELKAKFDSITAQFEQAELNLQNTKIKAPSDGFIAKRSAENGQLANPGIPLIGFVDASERWILANFKETEISDIKIGALVDIEVDAITNLKFKGVVESISSATGSTFTLLPPDNATGNFTKVVQRVPVKIKILDLSEKEIELLRAGLSVFVKIHRF